MSAVQRLRQQFEVLDGLARASPAGPARPTAGGADSAGPAGRPVPGATPAAVQLRRTPGVGVPTAAAAGAADSSGGAGLNGAAKFAPTPHSAAQGERGGAVIKSPPAGKGSPAVAIRSGAVTDDGQQEGKAESPAAAAAVVNSTTNGSRSPGVARTAASQLCNGLSRSAKAAAKTAGPCSAAPAPAGDRVPSPLPPSDAPPRPPKPGSDTSSTSGDCDCEPGDYLVPDGVPPVPPREPLSPEWGPARSPLVRRSLPPPPSGASLQQQAWFHPVDRAGARQLILRRGNGAFVVRPSQRGGPAAPFALTLLHAGQVYNFNVRQRTDGRFALGYHKKDEASFRSVEELVRHHQREPISLPTKARTCLTWYPSGGSSSP